MSRPDASTRQTRLLRHLERLVAFDTRNPPRAITTGGLFAYLVDQLPGFRIRLEDLGAGAVSLLAVRGAPKRVFNVHMDTVPAADGWTSDPLALRIENDRAIGLGACDIKGAAAGLLAVAEETDGDLALLFTSDEEANEARGVAHFLASTHGFSEVIVSEPTKCRAVLAHRGIVSLAAKFTGVAGHASEARALEDNAVHRAVAWCDRALTMARAAKDLKFGELSGLPFNLGRIDGGIKGNIIAPSCEVRVGFRPLPSQSVDALIEQLRGMAPPAHLVELAELFRGPPLPAGAGALADEQRARGAALAASLGMAIGPDVSFWTEAALFSAAGLTTLVYGPGDIAQAHSANEWVEMGQLMEAAGRYAAIVADG